MRTRRQYIGISCTVGGCFMIRISVVSTKSWRCRCNIASRPPGICITYNINNTYIIYIYIIIIIMYLFMIYFMILHDPTELQIIDPFKFGSRQSPTKNHPQPQGLASGKGKVRILKCQSWCVFNYWLVAWQTLSLFAFIDFRVWLPPALNFDALSSVPPGGRQDGKGKEKGKREPRQNFQSQKEMDKAHYTSLHYTCHHCRTCQRLPTVGSSNEKPLGPSWCIGWRDKDSTTECML